jgi:hypothetical protein
VERSTTVFSVIFFAFLVYATTRGNLAKYVALFFSGKGGFAGDSKGAAFNTNIGPVFESPANGNLYQTPGNEGKAPMWLAPNTFPQIFVPFS